MRKVIAAGLIPALLVSCGGDGSAPTGNDEPVVEITGTYVGTPQPIGDGTVQTWAELDDGIPIRIGVTLTESALSGLPQTSQQLSIPIPIPAPARPQVLFDHVLFDWVPSGHGPEGVYDAPHFDFHFYMVTRSEREAVPSRPVSGRVPVATRYLAADYIPVEAVFRGMGEHWADATSPEFDGAFTRTLIYVSFEGDITAIEPMITRAHLASQPDEVLPIKQPAAYQRTGHYPTSYRIRYNAGARTIDVVLESLVLRTAS